MRGAVSLATLGCMVALASAAYAEAPVVAVFDIQDRSGKFTPSALDQLTDYLSTQLAEGAAFVVVPRSQVRAALQQQKSESYKQCYDDGCQIDIGRELAAQKSLLTQIVQVGSQCAVTATLFDLRRGASERAANRKTTCDQDALVTALEAVAATLREHGDGKVAAAPPVAADDGARSPGPVTEASPAGVSPTEDVAPPDAEDDDDGVPTLVWVGIGVGVVLAVVIGVVAGTSTTDITSGNSGALLRF